MSQPKICLVIINFNSYSDTKACIKSLMNQTFKDFAIFLVDNNSTDGSIELLEKEFQNMYIIKNKLNFGFSGGCNIAIKDAVEKGFDYTLLLNNDTIADPNLIENFISYIKVHPETEVLTGKIYYKHSPNKIWYAGGKLNLRTIDGIHLKINKKDCKKEKEKNVDFASGCMIMIKRSVFENIGFFDEFLFATYEDVDFCIRIKRSGYTIKYLPECKIWHRVSPNFTSKKRIIKFTSFTYYVTVRNKIYLVLKHKPKFKRLFCIFFMLPKLIKYFLGFFLFLKISYIGYVILGLYDGIYKKKVRLNLMHLMSYI